MADHSKCVLPSRWRTAPRTADARASFGMAIAAFLLTVFSLAVSACSPSSRDEDAAVDPMAIARPEREVAMDEVGTIRGFALMGDSLLAVLDGSPPFIKVYRIRDSNLIHQFGRIGDGPGEVRDPHHLTATWSAPDAAWDIRAYEPNTRRLTHWRLADSLTHMETLVLEGQRVENVVVIGQELFGSPLATTSGPLVRANGLRFAREAALGTPPYRPSDLPQVAVFDANRHAVAAGGSLGPIAAAFFFAPEVQLFDPPDRAMARWRHPSGSSGPVPDAWPNPGFSVDSSEISFVAVGGSRAGVAAAYCGCLGATRREHPIEVVVLDWTGQQQGSVRLAAGVRGVDLTEDGSSVWVAYQDPEPHAIRIAYSRSTAPAP